MVFLFISINLWITSKNLCKNISVDIFFPKFKQCCWESLLLVFIVGFIFLKRWTFRKCEFCYLSFLNSLYFRTVRGIVDHGIKKWPQYKRLPGNDRHFIGFSHVGWWHCSDIADHGRTICLLTHTQASLVCPLFYLADRRLF